MNKQLCFTYKDKKYVLEYTRDTIQQMESQGFVAVDVREKPMTVLPALFAGAFLANHKNVEKSTIDEIYDHLPNKVDLIGRLAEMYNEPIASLMDEPVEGKVDWTTNW